MFFTVMYTKDLSNSVNFARVGLELMKHYVLSQLDSNCNLTCMQWCFNTLSQQVRLKNSQNGVFRIDWQIK